MTGASGRASAAGDPAPGRRSALEFIVGLLTFCLYAEWARRPSAARYEATARVPRPGRAHVNLEVVLPRIRGTAAVGGVSSAWTLPFIRARS